MTVTLLIDDNRAAPTCADQHLPHAGKDLSSLVPPEEWTVLRPALERIRNRGLRFALGGGFAFSAYSDRIRGTKDIDLFVLPEDRDAIVRAVLDSGFVDYFDQCAYDREWIYRGVRDGAVLDIIWQMANRRASVDERWLRGERTVRVHGLSLPVIPIEELIWAKLYVLQRDRCDWTDALNLLYFAAHNVDWGRLVDRVGDDRELLGALVATFRWLCPDRATNIPASIYPRLGLSAWPPGNATGCGPRSHRVNLLDTRDWFGEGPV